MLSDWTNSNISKPFLLLVDVVSALALFLLRNTGGCIVHQTGSGYSITILVLVGLVYTGWFSTGLGWFHMKQRSKLPHGGIRQRAVLTMQPDNCFVIRTN